MHTNHKPQNQKDGNKDAVSHKQEWELSCVTLIRLTETKESCHTVHTWYHPSFIPTLSRGGQVRLQNPNILHSKCFLNILCFIIGGF